MQANLSQAKQLKKQWSECLAELRRSYEQGASGTQMTQWLTQQMDELVGCAYKRAIEEVTGRTETNIPSVALIALGGFGRRHLCPYSDIDLMFLYRKRGSGPIEEIIKATFRQLWDMGLEVGHCARTPKDAIIMAKEDITSLTAMLEGRQLYGDRRMYQAFNQGLMEYVNTKGKAPFVKAKVEEREKRIEHYDDSVCRQEPHLKEGVGGLRDLHYGLWMALVIAGVRDIEGLHSKRILCRKGTDMLKDAIDYLHRLRHGLHLLTGKHEDHLTFARQEALAKSLGFEDTEGDLAECAMLRRYYGHSLPLKQFADAMTRMAVAKIVSKSLFSLPWRLLSTKSESDSIPESLGALFKIQYDEITFREFQPHPENIREYFAQDRFRLLDLVEHLANNPVHWSMPLCIALEASADLIDKEFINNKDVQKRLLHMFRITKGLARALMGMRDAGLLCRFFPEMTKARYLVRHDFYHRYTVDEHSLRSVEILNRLSDFKTGSDTAARFSEEALAAVWLHISRPELVRMALLFHDVGKGYGGDHSERGSSIVLPVLERMGLNKEDKDIVAFLIRYHLLMAETAFRRDLDDFKIVEEFSEKVGSISRLNKLLVLTYADICAVSPGMMTPWKAALLWQLYLKARTVLLGEGDTQPQDVKVSKENILSVLSGRYPRELVEEHIKQMPSQYVLYTTPGLLSRHLSTLGDYNKKQAQARIRLLDLHEIEGSDGKKAPEDTIEVIICTQDRMGLFRDLARCFRMENFHIISTRAFTRKDGTVVDTVMAINALPASSVGDMRLELLRERLVQTLVPGTPPPEYRITPLPEQRNLSAVTMERSSFQTEIEFLNDVSQDYSLIEIEVVDQPALLETIAACLTEKGLNIGFARMQKLGIRVVQAFYITDSKGRKITEEDFQKNIRSFVLKYIDPSMIEEE